MSTKNLLECMICHNIMEEPVTIPCQCSMCKIHLQTFEKHGKKIRCGACNDWLELSLNSIRVNKRFKESIESEDYLTDDQKRLKTEARTVLDDLRLNIEGLDPRESNLIRLNSENFTNIRTNIDINIKILKMKIENFAHELKNRTFQIEKEFGQKIKATGNETKKLDIDLDKRSRILEELFRQRHVSDITISHYKQELDKHLQESMKLKNQFDNILQEIQSVSFVPNPNFNLDSFGNLNSDLNPNLCQFDDESFNYMPNEPNEPNTNIITSNLELNGVSSTTQCERNDTCNSNTPEQNQNANYNTDTENNEADYIEESEANYDCADEFIDSNFDEENLSTNYFVSLSKKSQTSNGSLSVYKIDTLEEIEANQIAFKTTKASCIEVFQNNKFFIGTMGGKIKLYHIYEPKLYMTISGHTKRIESLKVLPGNKLASSECGNTGFKIWDIKTGKCLHTLSNRSTSNWIFLIEYLPNGNLITSDFLGSVKIYNLVNQKDENLIAEKCLVRNFNRKESKKNSVYCITPIDSQRVVCGTKGGLFEIWDFETGILKQSFKSHSKYIWHIALTPNGELISSSGDMKIKMWYFQEDGLLQKKFREIDFTNTEVVSFIIRKYDGVLISGNWEGLKKFDLRTGECLKTIETKKPIDLLRFCGEK